MTKTTINIAYLSCWLLLAFVTFNWIGTYTIWPLPELKYISFIIPFVLFTILLCLNSRKLIIDTAAKVWIPWLIFIIVYTGMNLNWERSAYHYICIILIILSPQMNIMKLFPTRLALFIGVFAISGVIVQFLFPTFHSAVILPLFPKGSFDGYGLMGFTYQLDVSANYILLFEMIWLYIFKDKVNPFIYWTTLIIAILTIFLTGKRMHSLLSIIIPIIVYFLAMPHGNRRLWMIFFIGSIGILGVSLFINNADRFEESPFLRRFSTSVEKVQYNEDITSQRSVLTAHAIKLWIEKPILGIGDSNFRSHTEAETDVHNAYIQVLCEQGIIGFILWFIPIIYCFILTCRIFKNGCLDSSLKNWLMVSLFYQVQFILYGLTGNPTINEDRYILYFFAIAILSEIHTILIQRTSKTNI